MPFITEFFAVTTTSLYRVKWYEHAGQVQIIKTGLAGNSDIPIGAVLPGGYFVGIAKSYITQYGTSERIPPELVDQSEWGGVTSPIVGLFLSDSEARECLRSGELTVLNPFWRTQTEKTIRAIGPDHPVFVFSKNDPISYE